MLERSKLAVRALMGRSEVFDLTGVIQPAKDNIKRGLQIAKGIGDDILCAECFYDLANIYSGICNFPAMLQAVRSAFNIYRRSRDKKAIAKCLHSIGYAYDGLGDYKRAMEYNKKALALRTAIGDDYGTAESLNNLGFIYDIMLDHDKALKLYFRALRLWRKTGASWGQGYTLGNIGTIFRYRTEYAQAIDYYNRGLKMLEKCGDRRAISMVMNNTACIYRQYGNYQMAIDYASRSLATQVEVKDPFGQGASLNNLGVSHYDLGEYDRALGYFKRSIAVYEKINDLLGAAVSHKDIAAVYLAKHDYRNAEKALDKAERISLTSRSQETLCYIYQLRAELVLGIRSLGSASLRKADDHSLSALKIAVEIRSKMAEARSILVSAEVIAARGNAQKARFACERALAMFKELKYPYWLARARALLAEVLQKLGQGPGAARELRRADHFFSVIRNKSFTNTIHTMMKAYS